MKQQFTAKHPWTILAAGAAIQVLTGIPAAWGVFQQPVMDEYGLSEQGAGYAFGIRKHLLEYDDVMNRQRTVIYEKRRQR